MIFPITPSDLALIVEEIIPEISGQDSQATVEGLELCEECDGALDDEGCRFCPVDSIP